MSLVILALACAVAPQKPGPSSTEDTQTDSAAPVDTAPAPREADLRVHVTLDGEDYAGAVVKQLGTELQWTADDSGWLTATLDLSLSEIDLVCAHPDARIGGGLIYDSLLGGEYELELERFATDDNLDYVFQDPGTPERMDNTSYCSHCHRTINTDWDGSVHRQSARNPVVHDVYAGASAALQDATSCEDAGGIWAEGLGPGTGAAAFRCYVGGGTLPDLNTDCGGVNPCDGVATQTGACADCHAPGINGALGGRDLLEATGLAHNEGVHCDVCHKVESIDLDNPAPGVAGKLRILRPSEPGMTAGPYAPLTFGPFDDVLNPRMGSVPRAHFQTADICAGCHQYEQPVLVPGESADLARWPDGRLPVHTTYQELVEGPMGAATPCQSCHMPPDPDVGNSSDLHNEFDQDEGVAAGWAREPGTTRRHVWFGPRHSEQRMVDLVASLSLASVVDGDELVVQATVTNAGAGHAIPTGEPLRHLILGVQADCDGQALAPSGGAVVPDYGGARAMKASTGDWDNWPEAEVGMQIRVIQRPGEWVDYTGFGPFGDGTFTTAQKGLPLESWTGMSTITAVEPDGGVTLDQPLPAGDVAYLVRAAALLPLEGEAWQDMAGQPGFAFARVMTDAGGQRMVPHHAAIDVASDNRLLPTASFTTEHRFRTSCPVPIVSATLLHRPYPLALASERGWSMSETVMAVTQ